MAEHAYHIEKEIFEKFPGYVRGVVLAFGVANSEGLPEVEALLRESEETVRSRLNLDTLTANPVIAAWREAYRAFGAKASEFRPSMEAMARRVLRGQEIPLINTLVDLGNIVSLRRLVPTGGHAIDLLEGDIALRLATGQETFIPFDGGEAEHPLPGEVVFVEGNTVLTRRWTWRQSGRTLTLPGTKAIEYNIDGLPPTSSSEVARLCDEIAGLIRKFCGGRTRWEILSEENPYMVLSE